MAREGVDITGIDIVDGDANDTDGSADSPGADGFVAIVGVAAGDTDAPLEDAVALMIRSGLGLGPWDAFHVGLHQITLTHKAQSQESGALA